MPWGAIAKGFRHGSACGSECASVEGSMSAAGAARRGFPRPLLADELEGPTPELSSLAVSATRHLRPADCVGLRDLALPWNRSTEAPVFPRSAASRASAARVPHRSAVGADAAAARRGRGRGAWPSSLGTSLCAAGSLLRPCAAGRCGCLPAARRARRAASWRGRRAPEWLEPSEDESADDQALPAPRMARRTGRSLDSSAAARLQSGSVSSEETTSSESPGRGLCQSRRRRPAPLRRRTSARRGHARRNWRVVATSGSGRATSAASTSISASGARRPRLSARIVQFEGGDRLLPVLEGNHCDVNICRGQGGQVEGSFLKDAGHSGHSQTVGASVGGFDRGPGPAPSHRLVSRTGASCSCSSPIHAAGAQHGAWARLLRGPCSASPAARCCCAGIYCRQ